MSRWAATRAVPVLALILLTLAACGVPTDSQPRRIARDAVPFALLSPVTTATTTPGATGESAQVYFISDRRLAPATRSVQAPPTAASLVATLLEGPTRAEAAAGLATATGSQIELRGVSLEGAVAHVDLSASFGSLEGRSQIEAAAQLVFTATGAPGVSSVAFLVEGQPVDVPRGDGTLGPGPLGRSDFPSLSPS